MSKIIVMPKDYLNVHFVRLGIKTVRDLQQYLQKVFDESDHQDFVITRLYEMLFPDWEKILRIEGFPIIGHALWNYICNLFIEFDRKNHPECFKGGLWINNGFSSSDCLDPWVINLENCNVIYS
jgi:hypothetical protein